MRLPFISSYPPKTPRSVSQFKGLNENVVITPAEFSAMKNMSDEHYPAISSRRPRGEVIGTIGAPYGLLWKNKLFYVDNNKCYYDGEQISGLSVNSGEKQLVGMGAYIVIWPDRKYYNTATGEHGRLDAEYIQASAMTFEELSTDSTYVKISATGIGEDFKVGDAVEAIGVNDDAFLVAGKGATKVISEASDDYIVVPGSIQTSMTGDFDIEIRSADTITIKAEGIQERFKAGDHITIVGCGDPDLNFQSVSVVSASSGEIVADAVMAPKSIGQTADLTFQYYFQGSDQTKISGTDLGTVFHEGDVVRITGCTKPAYNRTFTVRQAGLNYILIDITTETAFTQASGLSIQRIKHAADNIVIKRTSFTMPLSGMPATFRRGCPILDFVCEHDNRLWGCNSEAHEIYASKLGDPTNWMCFEGISTDSYTATVGTDGDFTGVVSYSGYVIFFKEQTIHMMYGSKPANFQLNSKNLPGVRAGCERSLQVVNETLFYVGRNGVYAFDGGVPIKVSTQILEELTDAVACQQDGRYYLSCLKGGEQTLLVFDPKNQIWDVEDDTKFRHAAYGDGVLYYVDGENRLRTITGDTDEVVPWMIESGDLTENMLDQKYISKAQFLLHLAAGAEANIYFRYDDDPLWHRKGTIHSSKPTTYTLPIIAQRCHRFRWKIEGKGGMKLLAAAVMVEGGSELRGTVQSWHRK